MLFGLLFFGLVSVTNIAIMISATPPMTPPTTAAIGVPWLCFVSNVLAVKDEVPVGPSTPLGDESAQVAGYGETFVRPVTEEGCE